MVTHAFNPNTWKAKAVGYLWVQGQPVYQVSSKLTRATSWDFVSIFISSLIFYVFKKKYVWVWWFMPAVLSIKETEAAGLLGIPSRPSHCVRLFLWRCKQVFILSKQGTTTDQSNDSTKVQLGETVPLLELLMGFRVSGNWQTQLRDNIIAKPTSAWLLTNENC